MIAIRVAHRGDSHYLPSNDYAINGCVVGNAFKVSIKVNTKQLLDKSKSQFYKACLFIDENDVGYTKVFDPGNSDEDGMIRFSFDGWNTNHDGTEREDFVFAPPAEEDSPNVCGTISCEILEGYYDKTPDAAQITSSGDLAKDFIQGGCSGSMSSASNGDVCTARGSKRSRKGFSKTRGTWVTTGRCGFKSISYNL